MGAIEELQRDCGYCRQPITLKWKSGPMPSEGVCLVVDQVFHDKCWAKFLADSNGKRAVPAPHLAPTSDVGDSWSRPYQPTYERWDGGAHLNSLPR
jgi:hypothetical protein